MLKSAFQALLLLVLLGLFTSLTYAQTTVITEEKQKINIDPLRAMGMGNAFTSISDDFSSPFYNPSGYSRIKNYLGSSKDASNADVDATGDEKQEKKGGEKSRDAWTFPIIEIGAKLSVSNGLVMDFYKGFESLTSGNSGSGEVSDFFALLADNSSFFDTLLSSKIGLGLNLPLTTGFVGKNFALMAYDTGKVYLKFGSSQDGYIPSVSINAYVDAGIVAGASFKLDLPPVLGKEIGDEVFICINFKALYRVKVEADNLQKFDLLLINSDPEQFLKRVGGIQAGLGLGSDLGIMWDMKKVFGAGHFKLGIMVQDWTGTWFDFNGYDFTGKRRRDLDQGTRVIFPSINMGVSYQLDDVAGFVLKNLILSLDYRDLLSFNRDVLIHFNMGAEIQLIEFFRLRVGLNGGYFTAGIGLELPLIKINAAYWAEELGNQPNQYRQDFLGLSLMLAI